MPPSPGRRPHRRRPRRSCAAAALVLAVASAACAPEHPDDLFGMNLEIRSEQPWASDPALRPRLHQLVSESCGHMDLDPSLLYGMTLRIEDGAIACGIVGGARGCTWRDAGVISVSTLAWISTLPRVPCVEDTPIPHELLHVKIGDEDHADPRWNSAEYWAPLFTSVSRPDCSGEPAIRIW